MADEALKQMKRVMVVGPSGVGKSTLARGLGKVLNLPVVHLDKLYWRPGWVEPPEEEFYAVALDAARGGEGCPEQFDWEFVKWVWGIPQRRAAMVALIDSQRATKRVIVLRRRRQVARFIQEVRRSGRRASSRPDQLSR